MKKPFAAAKAQAAVVCKKQQAVDEAQAKVIQAEARTAAWAARRKVVEEDVRKAMAERAAKEAADKAQAADDAAQSCTPNAHTASPSADAVVKPTDSTGTGTGTGHPSDPKLTGSTANSSGSTMPPHGSLPVDPPKSALAPPHILSTNPTPAPAAGPAEQPSSVVSPPPQPRSPPSYAQ